MPAILVSMLIIVTLHGLAAWWTWYSNKPFSECKEKQWH